MNDFSVPGTVLNAPPSAAKEPFCVIAPILEITGGLTLSQLCDMTGLEASTIHNWIKRGWVAKPIGKRYTETQTARIMIINMLRDALQMEQIAQLMSWVNGSVEDRNDDILPDRELYNMLCSIISDVSSDPHSELSDSLIEPYTTKFSEENAKILKSALLVMSNAYLSGLLKRSAQKEYEELSKKMQ